MNNIEVCFSTSLFEHFDSKGKVIIIVDILRASSVICTMIENGVEKIIPVRDLNEAKVMKDKGYLLVAERDGKKLEFADFGNSPFYFHQNIVGGKTIVYSTTNGTNAITLGKEAYQVLIGSYLNITALVNYLIESNKDILVLCAGWKGRFSLEDSVFAGELSERLLISDSYTTICDSTIAAVDLWHSAKEDLVTYIQKAAQKSRLQRLGLDDVIGYCLTHDISDKIPVYINGSIINLK